MQQKQLTQMPLYVAESMRNDARKARALCICAFSL